jgi:predicted DNA-binding protein (UPF0251 family)
MPRPLKWRRVAAIPSATYFKPAGVPLNTLTDVSLTVDEAEAIRLKDLEGLHQEECAERMRISRPTFHRVLGAARQKIADALINGKAVRIEGGNFAMASQAFRCTPHGHRWRLPFEAVVSGRPLACPSCDSPNVLPVPPYGRGFGGPGRGRGRGGGRWRGGRG